MKGIFTLCLAFIGIVRALAQTEEPDSVVFLDELVVSANKIAEPRSKLSQQIDVMSTAEIKILNAQSTADLLVNSGVVGMQKSQQGGGSPQLRGFEASRVVLMVDGVRMNNLIYRAGHLQNVVTVDNNVLDNIEILLGPSSTVYGSDALGGVISLQTRNPELSIEKHIVKGNSFYRFGSVNNESTFHVDLNIGTKKLAFFAAATSSSFGDLKMGRRTNPSLGRSFGLRNQYVVRAEDNLSDLLVDNADPFTQKYSGYTQKDVLAKLLYKPTDKFSHLLNAQFSTSSNIPRYDRLTDPDGTGLRQAAWYYGPQERCMISYEMNVKSLGIIADDVKMLLSYQRIEESRHDRRFNRVNLRNQIEDVSVFGATIDFNKSFSAHNLHFGFDSQFNNLKSTAFNENVISREISPTATRYPPGNNSMVSLAVYATDSYQFATWGTLNSGLRLGSTSLNAQFSDKTFFDFPFEDVKQINRYASGNIGVIARPTGNWKIALSFSTGYRVPNIDDLSKVFETGTGQSLIVPNPDVKPEKTMNYDLAITTFISDKVTWENNFFVTSFFDAIVLDAFNFNGSSVIDYGGQPTPVFANQNKRHASIIGWSSVVESKITSHISFDASFNMTKGKIVSEADKPLDHIPPSFGRFELKFTNKKIEGSVFSNFNGWKRIDKYFLNGEDNEVYAPAEGMPSWYTVNFRAAYSFNKLLTLQGGIDNIFDLQYRTFASGINAPGRNFFGTIRIGF